MSREGEAIYLPCDVRYRDQIDRTVDKAIEAFGRIDVLLSYSGIMRRFEFLELSEEDLRGVADAAAENQRDIVVRFREARLRGQTISSC